MTKEERKARRKKNRELRSARKALRKEKFKEFIERVKQTPDMPEDGSAPDYQEKFQEYWPGVRSGLEFVVSMKLSGKKLDTKINEVILLGDDIANTGEDNSAFQEKMHDVWKYIRLILIAITVFVTNDKDDEKIDKFIEIGDWLSGHND